MLPTLSWIDFSEKDRRKMLDVVSLFKEQDTRDELGIGRVRDAFGETLFPGTSTIMTRAKYFLFVPWIYLHREGMLEREGRHNRAGTVTELCRQDEIYLIDALERGGGGVGVIGIDARAGLQRLPSAIYWAGLGSWGIRRYSGSVYEYHRKLQTFDSDRSFVLRDDDQQPVGDSASANWHPAIPAAPKDFLTTSTFALTREEATFLKERVLGTHPGSLLAYLLDNDGGGVAQRTIDFPWEHPAKDGLPPRLRTQLEQSRLFATVLHGAALLYNLMLSEEIGNDDWISGYRARFAMWGETVHDELPQLQSWDLDDLWSLVAQAGSSAPHATRTFVEHWVTLTRSVDNPAALMEDDDARASIRHRERVLKGARARLGDPGRLDLFGGAAGTGILDYRWTTVRTLLDDILDGLRASDDHA